MDTGDRAPDRSIDRCRRDAGIGSVQGARVAVRENKKEMGELRLADRNARARACADADADAMALAVSAS